jgi:hypothetical protein
MFKRAVSVVGVLLSISACGTNGTTPSQESISESVPVVASESEIIVQAESAALSGAGQYTLIGDTSNVADTDGGYLYLGDGGATAEYTITLPQDGQYVVWIRQSDDGLHADGARSVSVTIGNETLNWINKSRDTGGWTYEKIGEFSLTTGSNKVTFTKLETTTAAFAMDKFIVSSNLIYQPTGAAVPVLATGASCSEGGLCSFGDTGPGGGIVFFDAGSTQSWGRYLEAAPNTWSGSTSDPFTTWGCRGTSIPGATGTSIGTGRANTAAIIANCTESGIAAQLADSLTFGGKSDWFLPSFAELGMMNVNKVAIGGFSGGLYWSSSELDAETALPQIFDNQQYDTAKDFNNGRVRPIRAFG